MSEESRPFLWLQELLDDPDMLKMPEPIAARFLWPNRITLLAAREKGGKSTVASAIAAAVSSGKKWLHEDTQQGKVLIVSMEEHPQELVSRLVTFGCEPDNIAVVMPRDGDIVAQIRAACEEVQPIMIIWDTLGAFADAYSKYPVDPGNSSAWTRVMKEIVDITREYGASLLLHHARKSDGKYRDSTAIGANVDMILEMRGEKEEPRHISPKGRGSLCTHDFTILLDEAFTGYRIIAGEKETKQNIVDFIGRNPKCSLRELREGIEARATLIDKVRNELLEEGKIINLGNNVKHCYVVRG